MEFLREYPFEKPLIFDTHAHFDDERFDDERESLLSALRESGVCGVITCGCDEKSSVKALKLAEKYDFLYAAVGIHPESIGQSGLEDIKPLSAHKKCVAIGEIGLDYYWVNDNKDEQKALFCEQLELSADLGLPVIIHDRDAHCDTLEILKRYKPKGVLHSFSGSTEMAKEIIDMGMYIGIGGVITFKNAKKLPDVVKMLPDDRILLETDAPYLTPEPYRGKINHSALIYFTAEKIAEIRGTTTEKILKISKENAERLFGVKV